MAGNSNSAHRLKRSGYDVIDRAPALISQKYRAFGRAESYIVESDIALVIQLDVLSQ